MIDSRRPLPEWTAEGIEGRVRALCADKATFAFTCQVLRMALMGTPSGSNVFRFMEVLGPEETLARYDHYVATLNSF